MIGAVLAAVGLGGLPDSAAERAALKARDLRAAAEAEAAELNRLEQLSFAAREARRARVAELDKQHADHERRLADALAADAFGSTGVLLSSIRSWRQQPSRGLVEIAAKSLRKLDVRSSEQLGQPLRRLTAALAFVKTFVDERPELASVFADESAFVGVYTVGGQIAEAGDRLTSAALSSNVVEAEIALRDLERAVHARAVDSVTEPSAKQRAAWQAQIESGRDSDFAARKLQQNDAERVTAFATLEEEPSPRPSEPDQSDAAWEAETTAFARLAEQQSHFDRLAAEQNAPRAVQSRT